MPLTNCEIELDLLWSRYCVISEISRTHAVPANSPVPIVEATQTIEATFQINNAKLYVPAVTLSINDNIKFLENIKQGSKTTISWNKYISQITTKPNNNNLDYLIDPTFRNINRLPVLLFKNYDNDPTKGFFDKYYMALVEIKDFNALIANKPFFDQPVKNKQEVHEELIEISRNDNYIAENLLVFSYHQNYYKLIGIDLSRQTNRSIPNFVGKLQEDDGATMFFIDEKQHKTILKFSLNSLFIMIHKLLQNNIEMEHQNGTSKSFKFIE